MTFLPANSITSYVPPDINLPEDPKKMRDELNDTLTRIIDALNDKDIAHYNTVEVVNGQKFFIDGYTQKFRNVYRKVINFGALPNTASKTIAHGITTNANTTFTRIYGTATDPSAATITKAIPIPYIDPSALANGIELYIDATNVVITTAADYSDYSTAYIILEWLQF